MHAASHPRRRVVAASLLAVAAAALALSACGGQDRPQPEAVRATTMSSEPAVSVPESTWRRGRVRIGFPDGLAVIGDSVYVKTDDGHVLRVDATRHHVEADVRVDTTTDPDSYCEGIGTDGRSLWACSAADDGSTDVVRLDPESLEVRATVRVDKVFDQLTLPVSAGKVWVLSGTGDTLTSVDTSTGHTASHPLGRSCLQAAATPQRVYLTCLMSDQVVAVDAATGKVVDTVTSPDPVNVVADDHEVWVGGSARTTRFSPDLAPRAIYPGLVAGREGDLLLTGGTLWVRSGDDFLSRVDTATGKVAARYAIDPVPSGGSLAAVGGEIWTSASDDDLVFVVDPAR